MKTALIAAGAVLAVYAGAAQAETIPERLMQDLQNHFDLEDFQAAGIAGGLAWETGNFRYIQEINPVVDGSRGGIGYAQWTGDRRVEFEVWASEEADLTSYEVNYAYLAQDFRGPYASMIDRLRETEDVEEATMVFTKRYLRPHRNYRKLDERIAYAESYLAGDFSGAGCQARHEVDIDGRLMVVAMCPTEGLQLSHEDMLLAGTLAQEGITFQFASPYKDPTPLAFGVPPEAVATLHLGEGPDEPGSASVAASGSVRIMLGSEPKSFAPSSLSFPDSVFEDRDHASDQAPGSKGGASTSTSPKDDLAKGAVEVSLRPKPRPLDVFGDEATLASSLRPQPRPWTAAQEDHALQGMQERLRPAPRPVPVEVAQNDEDYLSPL